MLHTAHSHLHPMNKHTHTNGQVQMKSHWKPFLVSFQFSIASPILSVCLFSPDHHRHHCFEHYILLLYFSVPLFSNVCCFWMKKKMCMNGEKRLLTKETKKANQKYSQDDSNFMHLFALPYSGSVLVWAVREKALQVFCSGKIPCTHTHTWHTNTYSTYLNGAFVQYMHSFY